MTDAAPSSSGNDRSSKAPHTVPAIGWIDTFLGTLVSPVATFRLIIEHEKERSQFTAACAAVVLVATLDGMRDLTPNSVAMAALSIPASILFYVFTWFCAAGAIGLVGKAFGSPSHSFGAVVSTMGWSFLPWIFMAPITCLSFGLGSAAAFFAMAPAAWVFVLQLIAINESYNLKGWQTLCLAVIVPLLVYLAQLSQWLQSLSAVLSMV